MCQTSKTSSDNGLLLWRHAPIDQDEDADPLGVPDALRSRLSMFRLRLHALRLRDLGYVKQFDSLLAPVDRQKEIDMLHSHYRFVQEER